MPLDAQAQDFLRRLAAANLPSFQEQTVAQLRAQMDMSTHFLGELPRVAHVEDRGFLGRGRTRATATPSLFHMFATFRSVLANIVHCN